MKERLGRSRTLTNLERAFATEAMAHQVYLYLAARAEQQGKSRLARILRQVAEEESRHAMGHLTRLSDVEAPPIRSLAVSTEKSLEHAILEEASGCHDLYPAIALVAREEGHSDIAEWFERLARYKAYNVQLLTKAIEGLGE